MSETAQTTERRIYTTILGLTEKEASMEIAGEIDAKDKRIAELEHDISVCRKLAGDEALMEIRRRIGMLESFVRQPGPMTAAVELPAEDAKVYAEAMKTLAFIKAKNGAVSL